MVSSCCVALTGSEQVVGGLFMEESAEVSYSIRGPRRKIAYGCFVVGRSGGIGRFNERETLSRRDLIAERENIGSPEPPIASLLGVFMRPPAYPDFLKYHTAIALKSPFPFKISRSQTFLFI